MSERTRPTPFLPAARAMFTLSLDSGLLTRRSLVMGALVGLPLLFALLWRAFLAARMPAEITGFDLYSRIVLHYWVRNVLPLVALFYGSALVADEVEGKTITFLLARPAPRPALLVGKFAGYLVTALAMTLPAVLLTFALLPSAQGYDALRSHVPDLFRDLGVAALTLLVYGALFTLFGVLLRRPLLPGLLFLFAWELMANLPGYLPRLTLTAWLRSLLPYNPPAEGLGELFGQALPVGESLAVLGVVSALTLGLALWLFSRREYVLDQ
jgi:ABC-type transport system involved in multi-copper enzyme maturation permease subunit